MEEAKKKNNIILDFITSFIYIPVYSLLGIKFVLWDMWVMLFNYFAWQLDKTVNGKADNMDNISDFGKLLLKDTEMINFADEKKFKAI